MNCRVDAVNEKMLSGSLVVRVVAKGECMFTAGILAKVVEDLAISKKKGKSIV